ncbi:MAG: RNA 2',3'-cyclic phosphodiesterase [bacterium]|nr:RNA 2',3'-cyclic phosphodiesterase [bacterium]
MHRLFVAIRPPAILRTQLLALMGGIAGARWQDDAQLHLTLRFIGDIDRHRANDLAVALAMVRFAPFDISLAGVGCFDRKGRIDTLWAGVQPRDPLTRLHHKIDRACVQSGLPPEDRAYLPHITLARFGRAGGLVDHFIAQHVGLASPSCRIDNFALFESHLSHDGATYHRIERYPAQDDSG